MSQPEGVDERVSAWMSGKGFHGSTPALSIIIPAYNEYRRLPSTLMEMVDYLDLRVVSGSLASYEIIVVDDGSSDGTSDMVRKFEKMRPQVSLIRLPRNYGKGHAVRVGMLNARGPLVLFADADGATPIVEVERLSAALESGAELATASRALASEDTKVTTCWYRKLMGRTFNLFVNLLLIPNASDTQCGFKMFTARAARFLFERQQSDGFSFDVEILFIAHRAGIQVREVPVNWVNVPGSKVNLMIDSLRMFGDLIVYKLRHGKVTPEDYASFGAL